MLGVKIVENTDYTIKFSIKIVSITHAYKSFHAHITVTKTLSDHGFLLREHSPKYLLANYKIFTLEI
jgi:hypothetical protein